MGAMVAIPGAFFCISRQLELLTSSPGLAQKHAKYKTQLDLVMCIIIPVVYMALRKLTVADLAIVSSLIIPVDVIVQDHRFTLVEDLGCQASVHRSLTGLVLVWLPPLVISLLSLGYNGLCTSMILLFRPFSSHFTLSLCSH